MNDPNDSPLRYSQDLDQSRMLLNDMESLVNLHEETKKLKTRRQFEDWNQNVHGAIMSNIGKKVNSLDSKTLNDKKNNDYSKFLNTTNRKTALFRDIIIESEYDPLEVNRQSIKIVTKKLKDPLKIDQRKKDEENNMLHKDSHSNNNNSSSSSSTINSINSNATGNAFPNNKIKAETNGRDTLSVEQWATGKIEATPHGVFSKSFSSNNNNNDSINNNTNINKKTNKSNQSSIVLDHFNVPKGREVVDAEMPRGKRIKPIIAPYS